jgi:hypothetical protein
MKAGRGKESQLLVCYRPETDIMEWEKIVLGQAGSEKGATSNGRGG